jgi:hypothetical protein
VAAGHALLRLANAAADVSDGLLADLGHICERSGVGAEVQVDGLPMSPALSAVTAGVEDRRRWQATEATITSCASPLRPTGARPSPRRWRKPAPRPPGSAASWPDMARASLPMAANGDRRGGFDHFD